jgi:hypothetical protein
MRGGKLELIVNYLIIITFHQFFAINIVINKKSFIMSEKFYNVTNICTHKC